MHTLLIHQAFVSPRDAGGTRHIELAKPFVGQGNDFTIIASRYNYLNGKEVDDSSEADVYDGVRVLRTRSFGGLNRSYIWRMVNFLTFMVSAVWTGIRVKNIDVVLGTSPPLFQAVSAWFIASIRRKPLILEIRDLWPEFAIDIGVLKNPVAIWLARRLENFLYARASHFIVNSPAYVDYLKAKGIAEHSISFIANGVDPDMFKVVHAPSGLREEHGLEDKFVVTYAGAIGMANDLDTLLDSAAILKETEEIQFVVVGDGKERKRLERLAQERGITNLTFVGSRPKSQMPAILADSDVCLAILKDIPMFRTTYPNKVFDYMAAERPTVLAIDGVIRKVIEDADAGIFVPPGDASALANAVQTLHGNPDLAEAMGRSGARFVAKNFNRQEHAAHFSRVVNQLVHGKAA